MTSYVLSCGVARWLLLVKAPMFPQPELHETTTSGTYYIYNIFPNQRLDHASVLDRPQERLQQWKLRIIAAGAAKVLIALGARIDGDKWHVRPIGLRLHRTPVSSEAFPQPTDPDE